MTRPRLSTLLLLCGLTAWPHALLAQPHSPRAPALRAGLFDELIPLYPDSSLDRPQAHYAVDVARGTRAGVHLLLTGLPANQSLHCTLRSAEGSTPSAQWFRMIDVPVEENTGLGSRTERFDGKTNPFVIRRAPFRVYEALEPMAFPYVPSSPTLCLRLEVPIPADTTPGRQAFTIDCRIGDSRQTLTFAVQVHRAVVPPIHQSTAHYTNWFSLDRICSDHQVEKWSEPFWAQLEQYAQMMARGRQNTFWFRCSDFFEFGGEELRLHTARLERYIQLFLDAGMKTIEGAPFAGRKDGDWGSTVIEISQTDVPAAGETGRKQIASMLTQLQAVMTANHWRSRWVQHIADEPTDNLAEDYKTIAAFIHEHCPGVPIIEASMSTQLVGGIDIWCPQVQEYQKHRAFFDARKDAGDQVWVYTCLIPGGPWLNRLLDQERLRPVYLGWSLARYELGGYLHWGLNHHKGKPFDQSAVHHPQGNADNYLPAGDSHILFPGPAGPFSSQRFEAHRIGMEDYELLMQLKTTDPTTFHEIMNTIFRAFNDYETDVPTYRNAKAGLLRALDESPQQ